jgi:hypothetical protein
MNLLGMGRRRRGAACRGLRNGAFAETKDSQTNQDWKKKSGVSQGAHWFSFRGDENCVPADCTRESGGLNLRFLHVQPAAEVTNGTDEAFAAA